MHTKQQSGFTLVELAVVVFLVGLLASLGLSALNAQLASSRISDTKKKQEIIKDALISYLGRNKRLPCPAIDNMGAENRIAATVLPPSHTYFPMVCKGNFGIIPYATLGLAKSVALDGWENFFSYAVSSQWTLTYSATIPTLSNEFVSAATMAFNVGIPGTFTVNDRLPAPSYATSPLSGNAAVFIVSHGKNGFGALTSKNTPNVPPGNTTDEFANVPNQTTWAAPSAFFQRAYTDNDTHPNGAFDDIVLFLNLNDFINPLMKDGALKSAESQWAEQTVNIGNAVTNYMLMDISCAPPTLSQFNNTILANNSIPSIDPWGHTLDYVKCIDQLNSGVPTPTLPSSLSAQFINKSTNATITYNTLCTTPAQLAFAITVVTDSTTTPVTRLPVLTNFTVAKIYGANASYLNTKCP